MHDSQIIKHALFSLLLLLTIGEACASIATPPIDTLSEAINQAGRQRMLTQRIVKAYAQELLDVQPIKARQQRKNAIALYERQLHALVAYAPNTSVKEALNRVGKLWGNFKAASSGEVHGKGIEKLSIISDEVLHASHQVVLRLTELSSDSVGHLVNIAGRQRMLSQRIAKLYMLRSNGLDTDKVRQAQNQAVHEFTAALNKLSTAPENTPEIRQALQEIHRQWTIFETGFRLHNGNYIPLLIALSSEKVLKGMNDITGMYARLNNGEA
jgi:nitrate/nitrite-specific signal transduction histidine kinase